MKNFLKDLFAWKGRWNRLKFWIYPMVTFILILPIVWTIAYISLQWYIKDAKEANVQAKVWMLFHHLELEDSLGMNKIEDLANEDNTIKYEIFERKILENLSHPFGGKFLLFVDGSKFQIYSETPRNIFIKWNYIAESENDPESLVVIDGEVKIDGPKAWIESNDGNWWGIFWSLLIFILYIWAFYISYASYVKRLRDLDKNPWMSLLILIPFANIYLLVICGFIKWTVWPNKYWADPLNKDAESKDTQTGNVDL